MKSRSPRSPKTPPSLCTFLKPGALAQIRYSKIAAKTRARYSTTLIALSQIKPISPNPNADADAFVDGVVGFEEIPRFFNFKNRYQPPPRCLLRKKLVAGRPIFTES